MPRNSKKKKKSPSPGTHGPAVRVRMYRSGLGDCFLVTFSPGGDEVHMLIDCGSLGATTTGVNLADVVSDIRKTTKDHLHLLVATHEHQDHISGFRSCKEEFKKIRVDRVWMAWTENPEDAAARKIVKYQGDLAAAAASAARALTDPRRANQDSVKLGAAIQSILGFAGDPLAANADDLKKTINEAMSFVRIGFGKEAIYKRPGGEAIEEDWVPGFRFYVLGPPTSEANLNDLGDDQSDQIYQIGAGLRVGAGGNAVSCDERESEMPFDARLRIPREHSIARTTADSYLRAGDEWRRIDSDWLHAAADLAIQLDSITNNTSLALAVERISDGSVLLFPADAQQGNWLSWDGPGMKWTYLDGTIAREKRVRDLLSQTVFYKVGHHSSHNATAKAKGLEWMLRENDLVAFIPLDRAVALGRHPKGSWQMPARTLYHRLLEKCQGRVVRSDLGWADDAKNAADKDTEKELAGLASNGQWVKWKQAQAKAEGEKRVKIDKLYIDFMLP